MKNRFLRLMQSLPGTEMGALRNSGWYPLVDVYRCKHGWLVKCELAGIRVEDLRLSIKGHQLPVLGIRRDWSIQEGNQSYSMEILYNRFERSVELPCNLGGAQIIEEYRDGMLLIQLQTEGK